MVLILCCEVCRDDVGEIEEAFLAVNEGLGLEKCADLELEEQWVQREGII